MNNRSSWKIRRGGLGALTLVVLSSVVLSAASGWTLAVTQPERAVNVSLRQGEELAVTEISMSGSEGEAPVIAVKGESTGDRVQSRLLLWSPKSLRLIHQQNDVRKAPTDLSFEMSLPASEQGTAALGWLVSWSEKAGVVGAMSGRRVVAMPRSDASDVVVANARIDY